MRYLLLVAELCICFGICINGNIGVNCETCPSGFTGDDCSTPCKKGKWGENCDKSCSENCPFGNGSCGIETGTCKCPPGFHGENCASYCDNRKWGMNCEMPCDLSWCGLGGQSPCHPIHGGCACRAGTAPGPTRPVKCYPCMDGKWGWDCENNCDEQCGGGNGSCGIKTGKCSCPPGKTGDDCSTPCDDGYWGINCERRCKDKCDGDCQATDGKCLCQIGYEGEDCRTPCANGTWGQNCENKCDDECLDKYGTCGIRSGNCTCPLGYDPTTNCEETCRYRGLWGIDCENTCRCGWFVYSCDPTNGKCSWG